MRASLIRIEGGSAWFAPHDHSRWLALPVGGEIAGAEFEPGQVGELEVDDSGWLFDVDTRTRVSFCQLQAVGEPERMTYRVRPGKDVLDLSAHGVNVQLKNKAAGLGFWRLVPCPPGSPLQGHFDCADLDEWASGIAQERARRDAEKQRQGQLRRRRQQWDAPAGHFVNPYTFVPFPPLAPLRARPPGHHLLGAGRLSGKLTAELVARSPLLVRNIGSEAPRDESGAALAPRKDGRLFIPGSSVHGALRSMHETLTGSCLRVFDPDFVPVYRDVASVALRRGWRLGVITALDGTGQPTGILPCLETRWVPLTTLQAAVGADQPVTTGQRFRLHPEGFTDVNGRSVYGESEPAELDARGEWVVLVTDPTTRRNRKYHCAVGRLPEEGTAEAVSVTDGGWREFRAAAEGVKGTFRGDPKVEYEKEARRVSDEGLPAVLGKCGSHVMKRRNGYGKEEEVDISIRWLLPRPWLHVGQPVWIKDPAGGYTDGIALSYLWRSAGNTASSARLPDPGFAGCHDEADLCPSCRIFGSADTGTEAASDGSAGDRRARQRSYRGHLRVLDATAIAARTRDEPVELPAAGSPRPGCGQFYLQDGGTNPTDPPRNRWGGPGDGTHARRLRGRKFYWHTDPVVDERRQRWRRHDHAGSGDGERAELVERGSTYQLDIRFDGLSLAELGGLIAALQPQLLFERLVDPLPYPRDDESVPAEYAIHLGGGKPWGLGSCQVRNLVVSADSAASRYLGAPPPAIEPADAVAAFADAPEQAPQRGFWPLVAAALHTEHVDNRVVGYPTPVEWADSDGRCSGKGQHESFTWFQRTTGARLPTASKPFVPLPQVADIAQGLPIDAGTVSGRGA